MSDEIEYEESDSKFNDYESETVPLNEALNEACYDCDSRLTWVLDPDPDSLVYTAECDSCETYHRIQLTHGTIFVQEDDV